jgi:hypothetical protein
MAVLSVWLNGGMFITEGVQMPRQPRFWADYARRANQWTQVCQVPPLLRELAFAVATESPQGNLGGFRAVCEQTRRMLSLPGRAVVLRNAGTSAGQIAAVSARLHAAAKSQALTRRVL